MRYHRIYGDSDGESHSGEIDLGLVEADYAPPAPPLYVSQAVEASASSSPERLTTGSGNFTLRLAGSCM